MLFLFFVILTARAYAVNWRNVSYHLLGVPYSEANDNFSMCAFSMKVVRWCRMLNGLGVDYVTYVNANADAACRNVVTIFSSQEREMYYGDDDAWRSSYFDQRTNSPGAVEWIRRTLAAVNERKRGNDILLVVFGTMHAEIARRSGLTGVEVGVGYRQTFSFFQVFESYTWHAALAQMNREDGIATVSNYHAVIPMCYYVDEFDQTCVDAICGPDKPDPYFAFVARIDVGKGILVALSLLCNLDNVRLKVAGTGNIDHFLEGFPKCRDRVDYLGVLTAKKRNNLLGGAIALLSPTQYLEPFGSVVVESMFLGTPVISSDQGGMSETVLHGVTGFRCRTLGCFVQAARKVQLLSREEIRRVATSKFDCNFLVHKHVEFFQDVLNVQTGNGWFAVGEDEI
jgi:glycosyltransferase involved in cell wall biosynthesis